MNHINYLRTFLAAPALICGLLLSLNSLAVTPGTAGIWSTPASETIFSTDFENADPARLPAGYQLQKVKSPKGPQVLSGEVTEPNKALKYLIPFKNLAGCKFTLTFYAKSPDNARCAIWLTQEGQKRRSIDQIEKLPAQWKEFKVTGTIPTDAPGIIELVTPSSFSAAPGKAFIDGIELSAAEADGGWMDHPEDFPAMCSHKEEGLWLAVTARPANKPQLRLYSINGEKRTLAFTFEPEGITGIGTPDIAEWSKGCVISIPVERQNKWETACIFFDSATQTAARIHYLSAGGSANIDAALDVHNNQALVVWQGNKDYPRQIYSALVTEEKISPIQSISTAGMSASNPDVIYINDTTAFAAWDSFDGESVNIYGAYLKEGRWESAKRLTSDPRVERHVHLASRNGELWMAWQAQAFQKHLINKFSEQRIVVAKVTDNGLQMIPGIFDQIKGITAQTLYMRPRLAFTNDGRLVLSARHSINAHSGWRALAWFIDSEGISKPKELWSAQGRWRPIEMAMHKDQLTAACQRDNLPPNWGIDSGKTEDWKSEVVIVHVSETEGANTGQIKTIPLSMPETDFSLQAHINTYSARLPRGAQEHNGKKLNLYWGDMHEHSDLSVCQRSQNPPVDDLWANQRDIELLDYTAITDHGYNMDNPQWAYSSERVRAHFDDGNFISLLAEEWTSDHVPYEPARAVKGYGHHNLVYLNAFFPKYYDSRDIPPSNPRQVWDDIGDTDFISIPHQLADTGNNPTDWTYHDEHHQPLAEIFQQRESYEYLGAPRQAPAATPFKGHYLQDAWAMGLIIGVIASPDHGGSKGKAAVWAEDLSREGLFKAFHARHTFGTSGARMNLWVGSGKNIMGDKAITPEESIPFSIWAAADRSISKVVIIRNNQEVFTTEPDSKEVHISWKDADAPKDKTLWYYVRIHRDDEELAWSSPIWFFPDQSALNATIEHAHQLPELYPAGPPADDPGPGVNLRKKKKKR